MKKTRINELFKSGVVDSQIQTFGWVRSVRKSKTFSFVVINDGSTQKNLQVVVEQDVADYEKISNLLTGSCVLVTGVLVASQGKGQSVELKAQNVVITGVVDETYPLQKKGTSLEFLREHAHLRARSNTFGAVFRIRHALSFATHKFFHDRGFFHLHTPIITASDCEGAGEMFRVTSLNLDAPPKKIDGKVDNAKDYFGKEAHLTVSGQLEAECYALGLGAVYTFGPTFRAENSNTSRHLAEFWMVEPEVAFADLPDVAVLATDYIKYLIATALKDCADDLAFLEEHFSPKLRENLTHVRDSEFKMISYTEAVEILQKTTKKFEFPVSWGTDLQTEHERYLCEEHFKIPVIVTDYPKAIKAFYMKQNPDGKTVRAMDVLVPGIGELIGGSQREDDHDKLLARIKEMGQKEEDYWWYLQLRKFGSAPHAGFGLGFERAVMYITGMTNIRDVIAFPRYPGYAEF